MILKKAANWVPLHPPLPLGWQQKHGDDDDFNMAIIFGTGFQAKDCEADNGYLAASYACCWAGWCGGAAQDCLAV